MATEAGKSQLAEEAAMKEEAYYEKECAAAEKRAMKIHEDRNQAMAEKTKQLNQKTTGPYDRYGHKKSASGLSGGWVPPGRE